MKRIICPCGYKHRYNKDKVVPCPRKVFVKYITLTKEKIKTFKDEPDEIVESRYCKYRSYGGPTAIDCSKYTRKEYLILTDAYYYCSASHDKKKVVLV